MARREIRASGTPRRLLLFDWIFVLWSLILVQVDKRQTCEVLLNTAKGNSLIVALIAQSLQCCFRWSSFRSNQPPRVHGREPEVT